MQLTSGPSSSNCEEERPLEHNTGFGSRAGTTNCDASGLGGFVRRYLSTRNLRITSNFRVGSCWVFIANIFVSPHQQTVLQSTTFWPGCPKVGIFFFCCLLENGWGNPAETSCFAKQSAGVERQYINIELLPLYHVPCVTLCTLSLSCPTTLTKRQKKKKKKDCQMSVYHKADPGELIQWVTHESRSSAASKSELIGIGTQPRTADAWHQWLMPAARCRHPRFFGHFWPSVWPSSRSNFDLGPSPLDSTEKSFISELMILECIFPLTQWVFGLTQWVFVLTQWVFGLTQWVFGFTQWVFGLTQWVFGFAQWVFGFTQWVFGFTQWVFGFTQWVFGFTQWVFGFTQWVFGLGQWVFGLTVSTSCSKKTYSLKSIKMRRKNRKRGCDGWENHERPNCHSLIIISAGR